MLILTGVKTQLALSFPVDWLPSKGRNGARSTSGGIMRSIRLMILLLTTLAVGLTACGEFDTRTNPTTGQSVESFNQDLTNAFVQSVVNYDPQEFQSSEDETIIRGAAIPEQVRVFSEILLRASRALEKLGSAGKSAATSASATNQEALKSATDLITALHADVLAASASAAAHSSLKTCPGPKASAPTPKERELNAACLNAWLASAYDYPRATYCTWQKIAAAFDKMPELDIESAAVFRQGDTSMRYEKGLACLVFPDANRIEGYPRKVMLFLPNAMPGRILENHFAGEDWAVNIAPGLWTKTTEDIDVLVTAIEGSWYGDCAAYATYEKRMPRGVKAGGCY